MDIVLQCVIFVVSGLLLMKVTDWFVTGAVDIAASLRLSKVFIGVTVVSIVTTMPELVTSSVASYLGQPGIAVGNAIGSVIFNIGVVFATAVIINRVAAYRYEFNKIALLGAFLLVFLLLVVNGVLSRAEAIGLLVLLALFLAYSYRVAVRERKIAAELKETEFQNVSFPKALGLVLFGGAATVLIARFGLVNPGLAIAQHFQVPPVIIGLTMMAIGTSLPELITAIVASRKGHGEIALGNAVGASIINVLLVLGVAGVIHPLTVDRQTIFFNVPAALLMTAILFIAGRSDHSFARREGFVLMMLYVVYVVVLLAFMY